MNKQRRQQPNELAEKIQPKRPKINCFYLVKERFLVIAAMLRILKVTNIHILKKKKTELLIVQAILIGGGCAPLILPTLTVFAV